MKILLKGSNSTIDKNYDRITKIEQRDRIFTTYQTDREYYRGDGYVIEANFSTDTYEFAEESPDIEIIEIKQ